jgi:alginate O-acetyltransferase complex protein AlgI
MAYTEFIFIVFLLGMFVPYFLVPKKYQWIVLLAASYLFYLSYGFQLAGYILFTTLTVYATARWLAHVSQQIKAQLAVGKETLSKEDKNALRARGKHKKRKILLLGLLANFGALVFVKYSNFIIGNLNSLIGLTGTGFRLAHMDILIPIGISFYTLQSLGYLIDVYRDKYAPCTNVAKFALFLSFFPQIIQGPISRYDQLAPQLYAKHRFDYQQFKAGVGRILWGFFKKMVIADRAAILVSYAVANAQALVGFQAAFSVLVFMAQVYADFSGGMDISLGIAQCCGITMVENFRRPHFAQSISEYWRRWHITLGSWMKDYLLYPLSLSKAFAKLGKKTRKWFGTYLGKQIPTCIAMGVVFMAVGIWHGAAWKYIAFGLYNGGLIIMGILLSPLLEKWNDRYHLVNTQTGSWKLLRILFTFFLVFIGKYFAMPWGAGQALRMLGATFSSFNPWVLFDGTLCQMGLSYPDLVILGLALFVFFIVSLFQERGYHLREVLARQNLVFRWIIYLIALYSIIIFGVYGFGFAGADFIYQGF